MFIKGHSQENKEAGQRLGRHINVHISDSILCLEYTKKSCKSITKDKEPDFSNGHRT